MKTLQLTVLFLTVSLSISAQETKSQNKQFSAGIYSGLSFNKTKLPDSFSNRPKLSTGYLIGVYTNIRISEKFSLKPNIHFIQKGSSFDSVRLNLNYLELPVLFSYSITKTIDIEIGPSLGYKISATSVKDGKKDEIHGVYDNIDYGMNLGVAFRLYKKFSLFGQYYYGIRSIHTASFIVPNTNSPVELKIYNRNLLLGIRYKLI